MCSFVHIFKIIYMIHKTKKISFMYKDFSYKHKIFNADTND